MTEDEMVGWHHCLNKHEFEQAPGDSEGQGSLACCGPWACEKPHMTECRTSTFMLLCNHHHHPSSGFFSPCKMEILSPLNSNS